MSLRAILNQIVGTNNVVTFDYDVRAARFVLVVGWRLATPFRE